MYMYCNNRPSMFSDTFGTSIQPSITVVDDCGSGMSTCTIDNLRELNSIIQQWNNKDRDKTNDIPEYSYSDVMSVVKTRFIAEADPRDNSLLKTIVGEAISAAIGSLNPYLGIPLGCAIAAEKIFMVIDTTPHLSKDYAYYCYYINTKTSVNYYMVQGDEYVSERHIAYYVLWEEGLSGGPSVYSGVDIISYWKEYPRK